MIIIDFSGLIHANIHAFTKDLEVGSEKDNEDLIRHIMFQSLLAIRKKYKKSVYGNIIIACDGRNYWRKEIFPHYKANRKQIREQSKLDWDFIFKMMDTICNDIDEVFPYKLVKVSGAEADDIIATLTKYSQDNELCSTGMYPEPQQVLAISEDTDFIQLHKYDNFKLYHPRKKKMASKPTSSGIIEYMHEHIAKAGDDGIPSILSDDDHFVKAEKTRQKSMSAKRLAEFKEFGRNACQTDTEKRNWDRNAKLIDFNFIPNNIECNIIDAYKNALAVSDKGLIFDYLVKRGCRQLLNELDSF